MSRNLSVFTDSTDLDIISGGFDELSVCNKTKNIEILSDLYNKHMKDLPLNFLLLNKQLKEFKSELIKSMEMENREYGDNEKAAEDRKNVLPTKDIVELIQNKEMELENAFLEINLNNNDYKLILKQKGETKEILESLPPLIEELENKIKENNMSPKETNKTEAHLTSSIDVLKSAKRRLVDLENQDKDFNLLEIKNTIGIKNTRFARIQYNANKMNLSVIPETFLTNESLLNTLKEMNVDVNKLKELIKIVNKIESPEKLLNNLEKLSSDAQIEMVYSYSNSTSLVENFLGSKSNLPKEDIKKNSTKIKR